MNAQEWRDFYKSPGAIALCEHPFWLRAGCPICGCTEWQVTNDCWAHCDSCKKGFPTSYPFTRKPLEHWGKDGYSCAGCRGTGVAWDGEKCEDCR